jgi:hypothetical protein
MKLRFIIFLAVLFLFSCTKSESEKQENLLQIDVTDLNVITPISIKVSDQNELIVLDIKNEFGNKTYYTAEVHSGDQLIIHYSSAVEAGANGDGMGTMQFSFKGIDSGAAAGNLGGPTGKDFIVNIP